MAILKNSTYFLNEEKSPETFWDEVEYQWSKLITSTDVCFLTSLL